MVGLLVYLPSKSIWDTYDLEGLDSGNRSWANIWLCSCATLGIRKLVFICFFLFMFTCICDLVQATSLSFCVVLSLERWKLEYLLYCTRGLGKFHNLNLILPQPLGNKYMFICLRNKITFICYFEPGLFLVYKLNSMILGEDFGQETPAYIFQWVSSET